MAWLLYFSASAPAQGQGGRQAPTSTTNQPYDPKDLSGVWQPGPVRNAEDPVMTPAGQAFLSRQRSEYSNPPVDGLENTDPIFRCEPYSVPRQYYNQHPMEIEIAPTEVIQMFEGYRNFRILYTDGRKPEDHPEGTWYGDSVAHWEGNTLVVETVNFNGRSWVDQVGHPTSTSMHLSERFTRIDHDHLQDQVTIVDPVDYTKPWVITKAWTLRPTWELQDFMCSPSDEATMMKYVRGPAQGDK